MHDLKLERVTCVWLWIDDDNDDVLYGIAYYHILLCIIKKVYV